jgi:cytidylate kinase
MPSGIPPANTVVVTISRQFGSGGSEIGQMLAQKAGLHYIDHEIINEVARRSGLDVQHAEEQDEQTSGMAGHILSAVRASSPFTVNYESLSNALSTTSMLTQSREQASLHLTQRVILELATQGNAVIVGRGSQFLLHGAPRTLHIYIFAPLPYRVEHVMQRYHLTYSQATRRIERADYEHDRYLRHYYGSDGRQPGLYHLLINTGLFSFELAANLIYESLPVIKEIR